MAARTADWYGPRTMQRASLILALALAFTAGCTEDEGGSEALDTDRDAPGVVADLASDGGGDAADVRMPSDALGGDDGTALELPPVDDGVPPDVVLPTGDGIFAEGCPPGVGATAREIGDGVAGLSGPKAISGPGDYLLMNDRAAFVITRPGRQHTYYHYGGIIADAVALDGCAQAQGDKFEELGLVIGSLDLDDPTASILRAFRGDRAEVLADGSDGGPAIVRVTGTDDMYWLVEYTLITRAHEDGGFRPVSEPLGIEIIVDYILEPGASTLQARLQVRNLEQERKRLLGAGLVIFGDTLDPIRFARSVARVGGFAFEVGVPWVVAGDGEGAYGLAIQDGNMASVGISGVEVLADADQALGAPLGLGPAGENDTRDMTFLLSVGATDHNSAVAALHPYNPEPLPNQLSSLAQIAGRVTEEGTGVGVAGAVIDVESLTTDDDWRLVDRIYADAEGRFFPSLTDFVTAWPYRLVPRAQGRRDGAPVEIDLLSDDPVALTMPAAGSLAVSLRDESGGPSPGRLELLGDDGSHHRHVLLGDETIAVPPGDYDVVITRGVEFLPVTTRVTVPADTTLEATLERVIDTSGFVSLDTHIHAAPSPDSRVLQVDRVRQAAAHGLEVAVSTEHEIVASLKPAVIEAGVEAFVHAVDGEEVTAVIPEHMTMFPTAPDGTHRGGFVRWYGLDIGEVWQAMRDRGAEFVILNHPGYMDLIGWDGVLGEPTLTDPTRLGLAEGKALWDWGLDGIEVMNGLSDIFRSGKGRFEKWQSMLNHGHRVLALGCSDAHGPNDVGFPRTYVASSTDDVMGLDEDALVASLRAGAATLSGGAFLRATISDVGPGGTATAVDGAVAIAVRVEAIPQVDVTHIKVFANCQEAARVEATAPDDIVKFDDLIRVELAEDAHLAIAAFGRRRLPAGFPPMASPSAPRAITNAIYVDADGDGAWTAPGGVACTANGN